MFGNWMGMTSRPQAPEPEPEDNMAALMAMMRGEFDDNGYYGITDKQQEAAKGAGLSALGQSLVAGAMSGSWGGAGLAINQGIAGMTNAQNQALSAASQSNMDREKYVLGREQALTQLETSKLNLDKAKEEHSILKEQRKAVMQAFKEKFQVYEDTINEMPEGTAKKIAKTKYNEMKIYAGAMDFERAAAAADELDAEVPEIRSIALERAAEALRSQELAQGRARADVRSEVNQEVIAGAGRNYVFNNQGEAVPLSPQQVAENNAVLNSRRLQDEATRKQIENYDSLIRDRSRDPNNIRLADVEKMSKEVSQAIQVYNSIVSNPMTSRIMDAQTRKSLAVAEGTLDRFGIQRDGKKPITGMNSEAINSMVTTHITNTISQINALEAGLASNQGAHQPGSPEDSIDRYASLPGIADAPTVQAKVNAIMATLSIENPGIIGDLKKTGKYEEYVEELKVLLTSGIEMGE